MNLIKNLDKFSKIPSCHVTFSVALPPASFIGSMTQHSFIGHMTQQRFIGHRTQQTYIGHTNYCMTQQSYISHTNYWMTQPSYIGHTNYCMTQPSYIGYTNYCMTQQSYIGYTNYCMTQQSYMGHRTQQNYIHHKTQQSYIIHTTQQSYIGQMNYCMTQQCYIGHMTQQNLYEYPMLTCPTLLPLSILYNYAQKIWIKLISSPLLEFYIKIIFVTFQSFDIVFEKDFSLFKCLQINLALRRHFYRRHDYKVLADKLTFCSADLYSSNTYVHKTFYQLCFCFASHLYLHS